MTVTDIGHETKHRVGAYRINFRSYKYGDTVGIGGPRRIHRKNTKHFDLGRANPPLDFGLTRGE